MKSTIYFINNNISFNLKNKKKLREWISATTLEESKFVGNITFIFCDDEYLTDINIKYLNSNYLTDIITFSYNEDQMISGDIMISIERVKENAKIYKTFFLNELLRVIIHGILHLCGYKDKSEKDKKIMQEKENYYLNKYC
ncbi:MAG: rRNA maturation RNase YbeY [Bacteroidales bacterium]|jgi:rRNA maturation RNase YbeY|nr:rRNA maturation RNase YbeY [Bacteroidales bacterium]